MVFVIVNSSLRKVCKRKFSVNNLTERHVSSLLKTKLDFKQHVCTRQ